VPSPLLEMFHSHGPGSAPHDHSHGAAEILHDAPTALLNPHAAWFALGSLVIKEWLYRVTNKVAEEEHSPVLKANALHHRADALTSGVALGSILGSSFGGWTFLDPVGGLLVSAVILQQGLALSKVAMWEFLDAGMDKSMKSRIEGIIVEAIDGSDLVGFRDIRGVKSGGTLYPLHSNVQVLIK
jgi:divalent metal cation (Fe/Co/Zn/Cd) transporter